MPEYVYVIHEFIPENPDEIPMRTGERIEVIDKDDEYQDGWWQGRNTAGQVGLFPQSYTSYKPPAIPSILAAQESANVSSSSSTVEASGRRTSSGSQLARCAADPILSNSTEDMSPLPPRTDAEGEDDGEMMKATMTDVQKAIEQLGRSGDDGSHSFSFASSHSRSTDHSEIEDDTDGDDEADGYGWSKGTRTKLAMRAQQANEERASRERTEAVKLARLSSGPPTPMRSTAPPIDVEMSDESEDEEEELSQMRFNPRRTSSSPRIGGSPIYPNIPEEDEEEGMPTSIPPLSTPHRSLDFDSQSTPSITVTDHQPALHTDSTEIVPSEDFIVPSPAGDETELPTARAEKTIFTEEQLSSSPIPKPALLASHAAKVAPPSQAVADTIVGSAPLSVLAQADEISSPPQSDRMSSFSSPTITSGAASTVQTVTPSTSTIRLGEVSALPITTGSSSVQPSPTASSFAGSTSMSSAGVQQALTPATTMSINSVGGVEKPPGTEGKKPEGHPSEWTVEQVVEWLKWKGFDDGVCEKFIEQEITGDVLMELDANVLKSEIGIFTFGKRARIINAITELRRPPSIYESPSHTPARVMTPRSQTGQSLQYSHSHSASMQSSAPTHGSWGYSPLYAPSMHGNMNSPGMPPVPREESPPPTGDSDIRHGWPMPEPEPATAPAETEKPKDEPLVGLGLGLNAPPAVNGKETKSRPPNLVLSPSPSDGALQASKGRRMFWRSESGSIKEKTSINDVSSRHSKDASSQRLRDTGSRQSKDAGSRNSKDIASPQTPSTTLTTSTTEIPPVPPSPSVAKPEPIEEVAATRRVPRKRETSEGRKASDRLSLFGGTFSGTLGKGNKNRKPPPSISTSGGEEEKHHGTFSRIREKRSSRRPSTSDGTSTKKPHHVPSIREVKESAGRALESVEKKMDHRECKEESKEGLKSPKAKLNEVKEKAPRPKDNGKDPSTLRKRTVSSAGVPAVNITPPDSQGNGKPRFEQGKSILRQLGEADHKGWMRKRGERYNTWKMRYFVLTGPHLYWLRSDKDTETKIKGYINIAGCKVSPDENIDPGRYGIRIEHEHEKAHYFSSEEHAVIREWMKALMKATITRDYTDIVVSSCNIPTIPLTVAQAMNPSPRPPSPGSRAATQKAMRPQNPHQLSERDAQVLLMGVQAKDRNIPSSLRSRRQSLFANDTLSAKGIEPPSPKAATPAAPPRPSRELRRLNSTAEPQPAMDANLIEWANSHLPTSLQVSDPSGPPFGGLALLRLAEDIKGKSSSPRVPDSAFPSGSENDKLDGLFRLFDFLLDNDVKINSVSMNDIRQGKKEKIEQLLRAMKAWEDKRKAVVHSL
ncbi:uncharacterized protein LAESUDRAFT_736886 [Laetiporus sulphureus 93-53]|uniref:PH-domain-containing protein n=1 Tax=Laetiporus sulphureus 93-53 TaxID=1314785 RepID=A0A165E8M7_9APHY|nr:uncharacterized protein LAESUDRAFT_736886 [Laetiporus sulphureus 93-53]KZT06474.1 hypothetical protein LAESUDRAFT_736886 [Laetiporus sulphureus 93-53]